MEVCVRLHAGTYVRMFMAVGWPKRGSLVCTYVHIYIRMYALTYICTVTLYSILHGFTVHQMIVTAGLLFISAVLKVVW